MSTQGFGKVYRQVRCPECDGWQSEGVAARKTKRPEKSPQPKGCRRCHASFTGKEEVRYLARIYIDRQPKSKVFPTLALAEEHLKQRRKEKVDVESGAVAAKRKGSQEQVTYEQVKAPLFAWWDAAHDRERKASTVKEYKETVEIVLRIWGRRVIRTTSEDEITSWKADMRRDGLTISTIRHRLLALAQLMAQAVRSKFLTSVPCKVDRPAKSGGQSILTATPDADVVKLVKAALDSGDTDNILMILLAADAGLRRSDMLLLHGEDIHLDERFDVKANTGGYLEVPFRGLQESAKGKRSRMVPILTKRLYDTLKKRNARRSETVIQAITAGDALSIRAMTIWKAAGLSKHSGLHELRHHFGTVMANDPTVPVDSLRQWMGHKHLSTTQGYIKRPAPAPPGAGRGLVTRPAKRTERKPKAKA